MKNHHAEIFTRNEEKGAVAVLVAILLMVIMGMAALAIDISHLVLIKNQLQNAADAGALAGARELYLEDGSAVNPDANRVAYQTAVLNDSGDLPVEVDADLDSNTGDVQRGHWSFSARKFTPNDSLEAVDLLGFTTEELDDPDPATNRGFINAVKVTARREMHPIPSFFAGIFGYDQFTSHAAAVAYIGFAGSLLPHAVDQPMAICQGAIFDPASGASFSGGRVMTSGAHDTGGWTDFSQENPCQGGTNAADVRDLICAEGNPANLSFGQSLATNGGQISSAYKRLLDCWEAHTNKEVPWTLTLAVVTCPGNNIGPCETLVGAVSLDILWLTGSGKDPHFKEVPSRMADWSADDALDWNGDGTVDGADEWADFVDYFNLRNMDGSPADYAKQSIYFKPKAGYSKPVGGPGGENHGILARYPVLVD